VVAVRKCGSPASRHRGAPVPRPGRTDTHQPGRTRSRIQRTLIDAGQALPDHATPRSRCPRAGRPSRLGGEAHV
jgi:hypothetical protein